MPKYMVEMSHSLRECVWALKTIHDQGPSFLAQFEWGCGDGEHIGWAIVEAENKFQAQEMVPRTLRPKTRNCGAAPVHPRASPDAPRSPDLTSDDGS